MVRLLACVILLFWSLPATARTVITYNETDAEFSLCAAGDTEANRQCAMADCAKEATNDADCHVVLECDAGWIGIAMDPDNTAHGFFCAAADEWIARTMALNVCIEAANRLCKIRGVVDPQGTWFEEEDGWDTPNIYYAQAMLTMIGYNPGSLDGGLYPQTQAAISAFEKDMGATSDGHLTGEVLDHLFYAAHGRQNVRTQLVGLIIPEIRDRTFGYAREKRITLTMADEIADYTSEELAAAMSVMVSYYSGVPCGLAATVESESAAIHTVTCENGARFRLTFNGNEVQYDVVR